MAFDAPFTLGPFAVDAMGRLAARGPAVLPGFFFRWRGRVIRAKFVPEESGQGRLCLSATLGRVPSTAVADGPQTRSTSFQLLHLLPRALPGCWRVVLLPDHRVRLEAEADVLPITVTELLVELTRFLLELAAYLDVLDDSGIAAPEYPDGSANT